MFRTEVEFSVSPPEAIERAVEHFESFANEAQLEQFTIRRGGNGTLDVSFVVEAESYVDAELRVDRVLEAFSNKLSRAEASIYVRGGDLLTPA